MCLCALSSSTGLLACPSSKQDSSWLPEHLAFSGWTLATKLTRLAAVWTQCYGWMCSSQPCIIQQQGCQDEPHAALLAAMDICSRFPLAQCPNQQSSHPARRAGLKMEPSCTACPEWPRLDTAAAAAAAAAAQAVELCQDCTMAVGGSFGKPMLEQTNQLIQMWQLRLQLQMRPEVGLEVMPRRL